MASFADYVKDLMGVLPTVNGNPMLSATPTTGDNARYMEDPFYKSRDIQARDQLALDEEERKRLAAQTGSGMLAGVGSGDRSTELTKEQNQFFDWMEKTPEGQAFKDERGGAISSLIGMVAPGAGLLNMVKGFTGQQPDLGSIFNTPQSFYDWQAGQQQSDPKYIADSIARINAESAARESTFGTPDWSNAVNAQASSRMRRQEGVGSSSFDPTSVTVSSGTYDLTRD